MPQALHRMRRGLSPFSFGSTSLEQGFADYQAASALKISGYFHCMSVVLLMVVTLITFRQEHATALLHGPPLIAGISVVILVISAYLPKTYKVFRPAFSAAYVIVHLATLIHWRNEMMPLKSADLALLHPARALVHVSAPLVATHLILMLGVPLPMHIHVPLHTFILMRHMRDHMPLCRDVTWLPGATAGPAAFILGTLSPTIWEVFTGLSLPGLDLIWGKSTTCPLPSGVGGVGRGAGTGVGLGDPWLGPAPVVSCSAVLSGVWLFAVGVGTVVLGGLEIAQRRAFLLQCRPPPRSDLENWPMNDGEYMVQTLPHAVGVLFVLWFGIWYFYLISLAGSL
jgi:hypothetical protein